MSSSALLAALRALGDAPAFPQRPWRSACGRLGGRRGDRGHATGGASRATDRSACHRTERPRFFFFFAHDDTERRIVKDRSRLWKRASSRSRHGTVLCPTQFPGAPDRGSQWFTRDKLNRSEGSAGRHAFGVHMSRSRCLLTALMGVCCCSAWMSRGFRVGVGDAHQL